MRYCWTITFCSFLHIIYLPVGIVNTQNKQYCYRTKIKTRKLLSKSPYHGWRTSQVLARTFNYCFRHKKRFALLAFWVDYQDFARNRQLFD